MAKLKNDGTYKKSSSEGRQANGKSRKPITTIKNMGRMGNKILGLLFVVFTSNLYSQCQYTAMFNIQITNNDNPLDVQTLNDVEFGSHCDLLPPNLYPDLMYYNHSVSVFDFTPDTPLDSVSVRLINGVLEVTAYEGFLHHMWITKLTNHLYKPSLNVNDVTDTDFKVYPNPTTDYINLSTETDVIIYDLYGNKVLEATAKQIDVKHLPKGVYIISINNINTLITKQ